MSRTKLDAKDVGIIQIITTCDGFTDGAKEKQTKEDHERYLLQKLIALNAPGLMSQESLAKELADAAIADGSHDNISIVVYTIQNDTAALIGVYDGHGGKTASTFVAERISSLFVTQCNLSNRICSSTIKHV